MHRPTSATPKTIHGTATIKSAPVICHLSSSQEKQSRLEGECARCGGQMETAAYAAGSGHAGAAVLHTVSIEAAWWLQKNRVLYQG